MLRNLVNADDLWWLLRRASVQRLAAAVRPSSERVCAAWDRTDAQPTHWFDLPVLIARRERLISGDPDTDHVDYFVSRHLGELGTLIAVSIGCGTGEKEVRWAQTGRFAHLRGYDLAPARIAAANRRAVEADLADVLDFQVGNLFEIELDPVYDLVIFEDALHHLAPVGEALARIERVLRPGGLLVVNDYVGPNRLQMTSRQQEVADGLLAMLPARLRRRYPDGEVKTKVTSPSRMRMILRDPSEAAESSLILPALEQRFEILEKRDAGGTLVGPVLADIAHNFRDNPAAERHLETLILAEEALLMDGELSSDYAFVVGRKRDAVDDK